MREIKFRAWNKTTKTMVDLKKITPLALNDSMNTQLAMQGMDGIFIPFKKDLILMQYTGLKDRKGKEIYEGDIIKHHRIIEFGDDYHSGEPSGIDKEFIRIGVCRITAKGVCFVGHKTVKDYHEDKVLEDKVKWRNWLPCISQYGEVICNIYENPERLLHPGGVDDKRR